MEDRWQCPQSSVFYINMSCKNAAEGRSSCYRCGTWKLDWSLLLITRTKKWSIYSLNEHQYDWWWDTEVFNPTDTTPTAMQGDGSIMLQDCFAASGSAAPLNISVIMWNEDYLQIFLENMNHQSEDWVLGAVGWSNMAIIQTHIKSGKRNGSVGLKVRSC